MKVYIVIYIGEDCDEIRGLYDTFSEAVEAVVEKHGLDIYTVYSDFGGDTEEMIREQLKGDIRNELYANGCTDFVGPNYSIREYEKGKWLAANDWRAGCDSHSPVEPTPAPSDFDMDEYMSKRF